MNAIKQRIIDAFTKACIGIIKKRSNILREVLDNPENVKVEACIKNETIVITIKKNELV